MFVITILCSQFTYLNEVLYQLTFLICLEMLDLLFILFITLVRTLLSDVMLIKKNVLVIIQIIIYNYENNFVEVICRKFCHFCLSVYKTNISLLQVHYYFLKEFLHFVNCFKC